MTRPLNFRYFIVDRINQCSELKRTNWLNWQRTKDYKWRDRWIITARLFYRIILLVCKKLSRREFRCKGPFNLLWHADRCRCIARRARSTPGHATRVSPWILRSIWIRHITSDQTATLRSCYGLLSREKFRLRSDAENSQNYHLLYNINRYW